MFQRAKGKPVGLVDDPNFPRELLARLVDADGKLTSVGAKVMAHVATHMQRIGTVDIRTDGRKRFNCFMLEENFDFDMER